MIRLLIVDDHEVVRHGLIELLTDALPDLQVGEAASSQAAFEQLMKQRWDLALLDVNIPGRNGLEILEEMTRSHPLTPALILSAFPEEEFAIRSFKLGASGYLSKNSSSSEILTAVKRILGGGKYVPPSLADKLAAAIRSDLPQTPHESLSSRELQVLRMVAMGRTIKEIAGEICLSEKTVGTYRVRVDKKLGLSTNVELTRYALKHRLVD